MNVQFETGTTNLKKFVVAPTTVARERLSTKIELDGRPVIASKRFWNSIMSRFGIADSIFTYFNHDEVFSRIADVKGDVELRYTLEHKDDNKLPRLLAAVGTDAVVPNGSDVESLFGRFDPQLINYNEGIMTGHFVPKSGEAVFNIGPDEFRNRYAMDVPVDGYGKPSNFLELVRLICGNGAVGYNSAFRQTINVGDNPIYTLERALNSFDDGEGFGRLRSRFDMAQKSWASVREVQKLREWLARDEKNVGASAETQLSLTKLAGDVSQTYGIVNLNALSPKKQSLLQSKCRMYDLINFASELATHHTEMGEARRLHGWIGETVAEEFDLEGTANKEPMMFQDFVVV